MFYAFIVINCYSTTQFFKLSFFLYLCLHLPLSYVYVWYILYVTGLYSFVKSNLDLKLNHFNEKSAKHDFEIPITKLIKYH